MDEQPRAPDRRRRILAAAALILGFGALTAATEIGGLVLVAALALGRIVARRARIAPSFIHFLLFLALYAVTTAWIVPALARPLGRVALPCVASTALPLAPATILTCVLNRHYIVPSALGTIEQVARDLAAMHPGATVYYLDAGFPFWSRVPMLPHLSHRTGLHLDLSFQYRATDSGAVAPPPSPSGYWFYDPPHAQEPQPCRATASWLRWDFLDLHAAYPGIAIDVARTGAMIRLLVASPTVRRILLEPHLQERLGVAGPKVAFAGCAVARHDDHLHVDFE